MRRSGSLARQMLLVGRPGRRRIESASGTTTIILPERRDLESRRSGQVRRRGHTRTVTAAPAAIAPTTPTAPAADPAPASGGLSIPLLPGPRTPARRIRFVVANACTVGSLLLGMSAIFLALNGVSVRWAALCLIACVVFDGLDGALARKLGVASPFGAQMDSLADMCSFGVAAPVVVYAWLAGSAPVWLAMPACALVAVCAAIRLARFNVSPKDGRFFCGVPTTMVAAVLGLSTLIQPAIPASARAGAVAVLALAMVSSFPYAKLPRLLRLPPWLLVLPVVGALLDYRLTFAGVVVAYLVSGPLVWLRQRNT
ncbi:CDP-alcohol phosphatidyltransferase [Planosporangium thailandense]|uniref:CDP-alcohol phosphatidyltransferase n=1 Tax=Planosporangium thailandense TaxID=765197 RepID=A0ABX0XVY2_9ACTN|nr:CDP-alcohol phosphatidyltransferase family protein [Planosporangium thailandense]NJC70202.1 CDP-alcohol phosphatidyltransferase [Planosporangium thailandense]